MDAVEIAELRERAESMGEAWRGGAIQVLASEVLYLLAAAEREAVLREAAQSVVDSMYDHDCHLCVCMDAMTELEQALESKGGG